MRTHLNAKKQNLGLCFTMFLIVFTALCHSHFYKDIFARWHHFDAKDELKDF